MKNIEAGINLSHSHKKECFGVDKFNSETAVL